MPIYAFQCAECGHSFDRLQKMSDPDPETCPSCGAHQVKRQLTAPSFRLSGSGWYETDFKKEGDKKRNLTDGSEGADKTEANTEAKTGGDAKPAAAETASAPKTEGKTDTKPAAPAAAPSSPSSST
jgi:putative FmdB family regulatory protein